MLQRLKILALLQISNKYKYKKPNSKYRLLAQILLQVLLFVFIIVVCGGVSMLMVDIIGIPGDVHLLTFIIVLIQIFSIISCVMGLMENLYTSKDNMILLAYPARPIEVFLSKLIVYYIYELIKSIFFFIPFFLGFGYVVGMISPLYLITTFVMAIILPLLPVLIGALVTIPLLFVKRLFQMNSWFKFLASFASLVALFFVIRYVLSFLPVPLRILAMYDLFVDALKSVITIVNQYGTFYQIIGNLFFQVNVATGYLLVFGILITLVLLVTFISRPFYLKMASKSTEFANLKAHKGENIVHTNTFMTFLRKEWLLTIRNPGEFVNNYSFMIATPFVLYIMMTIFASVDRNALGNIMMITFSMLITLMMATASNTASAMAVTGEGQEFTLLKTAPGKVSNMSWAKILFNLTFSTIMIILSYMLVLFFIDRVFDVQALLLMMVASILINSGLIFWSFQIDMLNPKLSEYASSGAMAHSKNFSKSIMLGFLSSVLFTILFTVFYLDTGSSSLTAVKVIGFVLVFFIARLYLFMRNLKAYFKEIEV